ncbi:MAG: hypothetical protein HN691_06760 [Bacteroidetes bacterium]|nr:hypothetical protein [Bacteroidota bacterium]
MKKKEQKGIFSIALILIVFVSICSYGQSKQEKTNAIIDKFNLIENQKSNYKFQLEPLKYQAIGKDSIRLIELEEKITEEEINKRISAAFDEIYTDEEINSIYYFIQTSAYEKLYNSEETYKIFAGHFKDIDKEIEKLSDNFNDIFDEPIKKFKPIAVDREDGFYATIDYNSLSNDEDIELASNPSISIQDILDVKKEFSNYGDDQAEIMITLNKEGARKFYLLTKENIGKPIAIVIDKHIISMPIVNSEIMGGQASISGDFTEKEVDRMIKKLKAKL